MDREGGGEGALGRSSKVEDRVLPFVVLEVPVLVGLCRLGVLVRAVSELGDLALVRLWKDGMREDTFGVSVLAAGGRGVGKQKRRNETDHRW